MSSSDVQEFGDEVRRWERMCNAAIGTEEDKSLTFLFLEQSAAADGGRWFAEGDFARRCQGHHGAACGAT